MEPVPNLTVVGIVSANIVAVITLITNVLSSAATRREAKIERAEMATKILRDNELKALEMQRAQFEIQKESMAKAQQVLEKLAEATAASLAAEKAGNHSNDKIIDLQKQISELHRILIVKELKPRGK